MQIKKFDWSKHRKFWRHQQLIDYWMTINCSPWSKSTRPEVFTTQLYIYTESEWALLECLTVYGSVSSIRAV